jgi:xylulokinase
MKEAGLAGVSQVRVTGGGGKSPLWRQILADVLDAELVTVNSEEGAAYGAALLAATGAGVFATVEDACDTTIQVTGSTKPGSDSGKYEGYYREYRALYPALKPSFHRIADLAE